MGHADNSYWSAFNMAAFTGGAQYNVTSVSFGVESANVTQSVTVRLYTTTNFPVGFPGSLTQIGTTTINVGPGDTGTVRHDAFGGNGPGWNLATGHGTLYAGRRSYRPLVLCRLECGGGNGTELYQCGGLRVSGADDDSGHRLPEHAHRV